MGFAGELSGRGGEGGRCCSRVACTTRRGLELWGGHRRRLRDWIGQSRKSEPFWSFGGGGQGLIIFFFFHRCLWRAILLARGAEGIGGYATGFASCGGARAYFVAMAEVGSGTVGCRG